MDAVNLMSEDWDERARQDAFHCIASWRKDWDPISFFQSGEEDYHRFVTPALHRCHWEPEYKSMLELGCGAGRMTRSFSKRFSTVITFDISAELLSHARALSPDLSNVVWTLGNGTDFSGLTDQSVDFVFGYIVLQHMPAPDFAFQYIREMLRVSKPDGMFLFQFNFFSNMTMNWKGRAVWRLVDLPWGLGSRGVSRGVASLFGLPAGMAGKSWRGASLDVAAVGKAIDDAGGSVEEMVEPGTPMTWCRGSKSRFSLR